MSWFKLWWAKQKVGDFITDEDVEDFTKAAYRDALKSALKTLDQGDGYNDIKNQLEELK